MDFIRVRLIEKIQLQAVALAALVGVYSLLAARVSPWDPQAPVTLLSQPGIGRLVVLAAGVWVLAAAAGALTVSARPEGPLLAALAGAAGVALYSPGIRPLLMARQDALRGLFFAHLLEVVALAAVVLAAGRIASFVRGRASRLAGGWGWRDPLQQLTDEQRRTIGEIDVDRMAWVGGPVAMVRIGLTMLLSKTGKAGARKQAQDGQETPSLKRLLGCLAISAVVSALMLMALLQSADRGQILFAVFAAFLLGALVGHQVSPSRFGLAAWVLPTLFGLGAMLLAAVSSVPDAWRDVPLYAHVLPVDWVIVGSAGSITGLWLSSRWHEARYLEVLAEAQLNGSET